MEAFPHEKVLFIKLAIQNKCRNVFFRKARTLFRNPTETAIHLAKRIVQILTKKKYVVRSLKIYNQDPF